MPNKDIDFRFKLHPLTGDLVVKKNEASIEQSMKSIMLTSINDRPLNNNSFGVGLNGFLFESFDPFTSNWLTQKIRLNLETFEERIQVLDVIVSQNADTLDIAVSYKLKKGGKIADFNLTLERVL